MNHKIHITKNSEFYKEYREVNPFLLMGLIIISFGFIIISWIYKKNQEFETLDDDAPNPQRGALLIFLLPLSWFFISNISSRLIFEPNTLFYTTNIIIWSILIILIYKYIYDFCASYARITKSLTSFWFILFVFLGFGIYGLAIGFYPFLPFLIFLLITIPGMQAGLNTLIKKISIKRASDRYYNS